MAAPKIRVSTTPHDCHPARAYQRFRQKRRRGDCARALHERKVEILSTGGTAKLLAQNGIGVTEVADYTGFPEMLDGRVKTLHPKVHGGILGRRDLKTHTDAMQKHGIPPIDLVVVNLYPFEQTVAKPNCPLDEAIENIDIGGPTLLRAAAKNHGAVTVVVDSADYGAVLDEMKAHKGATTEATRFRLAVKAFEHTARYDGAIANWLGAINAGGGRDVFPHTFNMQFVHASAMRYGENPHQQAAFYVVESRPGRGLYRHRARAPGQGAVLQQHRRRRRRARMREVIRRNRVRDCETRQPLRRRRGRQCARCLQTRLRHRSDLGLRRHHRLQPAARRGHRQGHPRAPVRRGHHRARGGGGRQSRSSPPSPTCACLPPALGTNHGRRVSISSALPAACWCRTWTAGW